jgi:hypothetical protein
MLRKALMRRSEGRRSRHEELVFYNFLQSFLYKILHFFTFFYKIL